MPQVEIIRAQSTPEDGVLLTTGFGNQQWVPKPIKVYSDKVRQKTESPYDDKQSGSVIKFEIDKDAVLLEDLSLEFIRPAVAVPVDGTYIRYQDFASLACIEYIEYKYTSNNIVRYEPIFDFDSCYLSRCDETKRCYETLNDGNLSAAQRNTQALSPQKTHFLLPSPWRGIAGNEPILTALANKIIISVKFNRADAILQSDGTKPRTITFTDIKLTQQKIHMTGSDREEITAATMSPDGISYKFDEPILEDIRIPAGALGLAQPFKKKVENFTGPTTHITGILRRAVDLDTSSNDPNFYSIDGSLLQGLQFEMKSGVLSLFEPTTTDKQQIYYDCKYRYSGPETQQIRLFWDEKPDAVNCSSGHISFSNFDNPQIFIRSENVNAEEYVLTLIGHRHNWNNHQAGNLQKIWN